MSGTVTVPGVKGKPLSLKHVEDVGGHFSITQPLGADDAEEKQLTHQRSGRIAGWHMRLEALRDLAARLEAVPGIDWDFGAGLGDEDRMDRATRLAGPVVRKWVTDSEDKLEVVVEGDLVVVRGAEERARRELGLASSVPAVNALARDELVAVVVARQRAPFPLGDEAQHYADALRKVRAGKAALTDPSVPLGELRYALAVDGAQGCNAPTDMYLREALRAREEMAS